MDYTILEVINENFGHCIWCHGRLLTIEENAHGVHVDCFHDMEQEMKEDALTGKLNDEN